MHTLWKEKEGFFVTEKRLLDQKRLILERQWLSHVELEEIRRRSDNNYDLSVLKIMMKKSNGFLVLMKMAIMCMNQGR